MRIQDIFILAYALLEGGYEAVKQRWHQIEARPRQPFSQRGTQRAKGSLPSPWSDWQLLTAGSLLFSATIWLCFLPLMLHVESLNQLEEGKHKHIQHFQPKAVNAPSCNIQLPRSTTGHFSAKNCLSVKQERKLKRFLSKEELHLLEKKRTPAQQNMITKPILLNKEQLEVLMGTHRLAWKHQQMGKVVLRVLVDKDGKAAQHLVLASPSPTFLSAVESQLDQARFLPAIKQGQPTYRWTTIQFEFNP